MKKVNSIFCRFNIALAITAPLHRYLALAFLLSTCTFKLTAQVFLAPYDIVNSDLRYLQVSGTLSGLDLNQLPVLSDELIKTVRKDLSQTSLTGTQRSLLHRVRQSYTYSDTTQNKGLLNRLIEKVLVSQVKEPQFYVGGRFDFSTVSDPARFYPEFRTFAAAILPYGISVINVMIADPYATENPEYIGKEWRGISGYTEQAYMLWQTKFSRFMLGRSYLVNSPGRGANLLFSGAARPMDQLRFEFFNKHFNFQSMAAQLDPINGADRYLHSHRLTLYLKRWQLSVTEAVLYGGVGQRLEFAYLNPFVFYHAEQLNGPGLAGNTLGTVEINYTGDRWFAYTEILIDDVQLDNEIKDDLEPNEVGLVAGFDLADPLNIEGLYLGLEYMALTNRTYKTADPIEWHTHRNVPIGYSSGSDLDGWDLEIKKYLNRWQAILNIRYLRQGEGELDVAWDMPWRDSTVTMESGYNEPFPTGIVEQTLDLGLELRWLPSYQRYGFLRLNYQTIQNFNHSAEDKQNLILTLGLHWDFRISLD